jgi:hypothetical protein
MKPALLKGKLSTKVNLPFLKSPFFRVNGRTAWRDGEKIGKHLHDKHWTTKTL